MKKMISAVLLFINYGLSLAQDLDCTTQYYLNEAAIHYYKDTKQAFSNYEAAIQYLNTTKQPEQLATVYQQKATYLFDHLQFDESLHHLLQAEQLLQTSENDSLKASIHLSIGKWYIEMEQYDKAISSLDLAKENALKQSLSSLLWKIHFEEAWVYAYRNDYSNATKMMYQALEYCDTLDYFEAMHTHWSIYVFGQDYGLGSNLNTYHKEKAKTYIQKINLNSYRYSSDVKTRQKLILIYRRWSYLSSKEEKIIDYQKKALAFSNKLYQAYPIAPILQSYFYSSYYYANSLENDDVDKSQYYLEKSLPVARQLQDVGSTINALRDLADIAIKKKQYDKAHQYLKEATPLVHQIDGYWYPQSVADCWHDYYIGIGDYKKALAYYQTAIVYSDSIKDEEKTNALLSQQIRYEFNQKKELDSIQNVNQQLLLTNQVSQAKRTRNLFVVFATILLGALLALWLSFRRQKKLNLSLQEKKDIISEQNQSLLQTNSENQLLLKEIHHRVKNNLQTLSSLLSLQSASIEDEVALKAIQDSQRRVESIAAIHLKLYENKNLHGIEFGNYLQTLFDDLSDVYQYEENRISFKYTGSPIVLDLDTSIPLALLVNELITNSFKYAFPDKSKGLIQVLLKQEKERLQMEYLDDGIGMTQKQGTGFGSQLIQLLCLQLQGKSRLQEVEKGIHYQFEFAYYQVL